MLGWMLGCTSYRRLSFEGYLYDTLATSFQLHVYICNYFISIYIYNIFESNPSNPSWDSSRFVWPQESEDEQIGPEQGLFLLRADVEDLPFREQQIDYAAWIVSDCTDSKLVAHDISIVAVVAISLLHFRGLVVFRLEEVEHPESVLQGLGLGS